MTNKNFINTNQRGVIIPVYCEDNVGIGPISTTFGVTDLAKYYDLMSADQVSCIKDRLNFGPFVYNTRAVNWTYRLKLTRIYDTLFSFKSKVKGIIKLRKLSNPDEGGIVLDDNNDKLFMHRLSSLQGDGITWSPEALHLMLDVLREQKNRWIRIQKKHADGTLKEKLNAFIKSATGQDTYYYNDYFALYMILIKLPQMIDNWEIYVREITTPVDVTTTLFSQLYYYYCGKTLANFKLGVLGNIFKAIKKPLTDLLLTFTTNPIERKFLEYKKA